MKFRREMVNLLYLSITILCRMKGELKTGWPKKKQFIRIKIEREPTDGKERRQITSSTSFVLFSSDSPQLLGYLF